MGGMSAETFTAVDLSKLPPPKLVEELDYETILAEWLVAMKLVMPGYIARESDPAMKVIQIGSYREMLIRQRVNDAAYAVMPAYAEGSDLDQIGARSGIARFMLEPGDPDNGIPETMESDEDFRRRIVLAPEGFSVAGPEGAYISHSLSADARVLDASAYSPQPDDIRQLVLDVLAAHSASPALVAAMTSALDTAKWPGDVIVSILSREGDGTATGDLTDAVSAYLSAETRRPLTDHVIAQSAQIIAYNVEAVITTFSGPDSAVVMATAQASLDRYVAASHRMGRDITISGLHAALHVEGVHNVALVSPVADIIVDRTSAAYCTGTSLTFAGIGE